MSDLRVSGPRPAAAPDPEELRLRRVAQQMEGMFVQELFKAMRETVPKEGVMNGGAGEDLFQSMMDEHLAGQVPSQWENGLGAAIYRQLRGPLGGAGPVGAATPGAGDSH